MLWQLPPTLSFDPQRLASFFSILPRTTGAATQLAIRHDGRLTGDQTYLRTDADRPVRHALEVRHTSFSTPRAVELCREHDIAIVLADTAGRWPRIDEPTTTFRYARLHGDTELYTSGYTDKALDRWADVVRRWSDAKYDAFVYFDNDLKVRVPYDAIGLIGRLAGTSAA